MSREKKISKDKDSHPKKNDDSSVQDHVSEEEGDDSIVLNYDTDFESSSVAPKKDARKTSSYKTSKKSSSKERKYEFQFPYTNKTLPSSDRSIASAGSKRASKSDDEKKKK